MNAACMICPAVSVNGVKIGLIKAIIAQGHPKILRVLFQVQCVLYEEGHGATQLKIYVVRNAGLQCEGRGHLPVMDGVSVSCLNPNEFQYAPILPSKRGLADCQKQPYTLAIFQSLS